MNYKTERSLTDAALITVGAVLVAGLVYVMFGFVLWEELPSVWSMDTRLLAALLWFGASTAVCGVIVTRD